MLTGTLVAVHAGVSVADVATLFATRSFGSVVVVDDEDVAVGIVSDRNLLRVGPPFARRDRRVQWSFVARRASARAVMSSVTTILEHTPILDAIRQLASAHAREAVLVTSEKVVLGMVGDVQLLRWLNGLKPDGPGDA